MLCENPEVESILQATPRFVGKVTFIMLLIVRAC
jgi:hypothetical protein